MIERWLFLFSGFQQSRAHPCGMESLWLGMRKIASPTTSIQINNWNADAEALAAFCKRCSKPAPTIHIAAYSWGANAAIQFCEGLRGYGMGVNHLVLCDGVRRIPSVTRVLSALSMTRLLSLTVPRNVDACTYFTQRQNRPAGHRVVAASEQTKLINGGVLERRHESMDEAPEFVRVCAEVAGVQ